MSTNLLIAWDNLVTKDTTTITASTSNPLYPIDLVATNFRQNRWHSTGLDEWIKFSWGSGSGVSCIVLQDHNLTEDATIMLYGSDDGSSFEALVPISITGDPIVMYTENPQFSYHKLTIQDPTNPDGYVSIGHIFMGTHIECSKNYDYGWSRTKKPMSSKVRTPNGISHTAVRPSYTELKLPFTYVPDDLYQQLLEFSDSVDIHTPFFVTTDHDVTVSGTTYFVTFTSPPDYKNIPPTLWNFEFVLEEEL
jgi:hypothetical protein